MKNHKIAAIPGDGIGKEVIAAGLEVLNACAALDGAFSVAWETFDWGSDYYKEHGILMPEDGLERLCDFDSIYFGAVGAPGVPDHITLWGLRLAICQRFDQYANVRPTRILRGIQSPLRGVTAKDLNWVIVRENSEGEYSGQGGRSHRGLPEEVGTEVSIYTRIGVTRIMRFAFAQARSRPRKLLTAVTKSNAQRHGMVMWDEIAAEGGAAISGRRLGQDARRCDDRPHDTQTRHARHHRGDKPACRHFLGSGGCAGRFPRHRAYGKLESRREIPVDV